MVPRAGLTSFLPRPKPARHERTPRFRCAPGISGGGQLDPTDVGRLAAEGFRSILDVREEGDAGQVVSPNVEATWAHTYALEHARASLSAEHPRTEVVDGFLAELAHLPRPVFVHSGRGRRAAALLTIHLALERGLGGEQALATAKSMGMDCATEVLERFVIEEVARRGNSASPAAT